MALQSYGLLKDCPNNKILKDFFFFFFFFKSIFENSDSFCLIMTHMSGSWGLEPLLRIKWMTLFRV